MCEKVCESVCGERKCIRVCVVRESVCEFVCDRVCVHERPLHCRVRVCVKGYVGEDDRAYLKACQRAYHRACQSENIPLVLMANNLLVSFSVSCCT